MDLFQSDVNSFRALILRKNALYCVLVLFRNPTLLCYFPKVNFSFGCIRNLKCLKNRTLLELDPGLLPTAKMELFVTIFNC